MNPNVDQYLIDGCGRCQHYKTPQCKVNTWREELIELRKILLETELKEEYKWSQPCYTINGKNVLIVSAFKDYAFISFFKGSLLEDTHQLLHAPGKSSQADRQLRYTSIQDIFNQRDQITSYIEAAIAVEKAGKKVAYKKTLEPFPAELLDQFKEDRTFEMAFRRLTPGRQRGYILYFSQPKKSETRVSRIEKWKSEIMEGKGMHDDYRASIKTKK